MIKRRPWSGRNSSHGGDPVPSPRVIKLCDRATSDNFDETGYLMVNPDVVAVSDGSPDFGWRHFLAHGLAEERSLLLPSGLAQVNEARRQKLARFGISLPMVRSRYADVEMEMASSGQDGLPVPYELVSSNVYDPGLIELVDSNPDNSYLDVGAGLRGEYRENVLYVEIAALPSTDVLSYADELPLEKDSFDGVFCLAVLEHVPQPWKVAEELLRVVKPGGEIVVDWPFLQPVHGYPSHYFNATEMGARKLFEDLGGKVETSVPLFLHPIFSLRWIVDEWQRGLPEEARAHFLDLSLADLVARSAVGHLGADWVTDLPPRDQSIISAGTRLQITKS